MGRINTMLHIYNLLNDQDRQYNNNSLHDKLTCERARRFTFNSCTAKVGELKISRGGRKAWLHQFQKNFKDFNT